MKRWSGFLQLTILALLIILVVYIFFGPSSPVFQSGHDLLEVTFLDVGQGDATFIESPSGIQVLVDGGAGQSVLRALGRELNFFDRDIDIIVATHPDQDHIGGFIDVLERYSVRTIIMTENESDTPVSDLFRIRAEEEGSTILYARRGQRYDLGVGAAGSSTLTIFFPDRDPIGFESNTSSIVSQLKYGEIEFMLTGDAPIAIEEYLVELSGDALQSEVLKAGHHGSRTSTSELFLNAVRPRYAVISAGRDNTYGHPHKEVVDKLQSANIETKNTAESGSIHFVSDGTNVWIK